MSCLGVAGIHAQEQDADPNVASEIPDWFYVEQGEAEFGPPVPRVDTDGDQEPQSSSQRFFQRRELGAARDVRHLDQLLAEAKRSLKEGRRGQAQRLFERVIAEGPESVQSNIARQQLARLYQPSSRAPVKQGHGQVAEHRLPPRVSDRAEDQFISLAGDRVFFSQGSAKLGVRAQAVLRAQARYLKRVGRRFGVLVLGHSDDGALVTKEADSLSLKRAIAVRSVLVAEGIDARRIAVEGRGRQERIASCPSALCQAQNRRAVSVLLEAPPRLSDVGVRGPEFSQPVRGQGRAVTQ